MNLTLIEGKASITLTTEQEAQMIYLAAQAYAAARAEQDTLAQVYTANQLAKRLNISLRVVRDMLTEGRIRYKLVGKKKGYRITELAVRQYLGDME